MDHLHGTLTDLRCEACRHVFNVGYNRQEEGAFCPSCGSERIRHNVVMFGEAAPAYLLLHQVAAEAGLFIAVGTSGQAIDIVDLARSTPQSIYFNPKRERHTTAFGDHEKYIDEYFSKTILQTATEGAEEMQADVRRYLTGSG